MHVIYMIWTGCHRVGTGLPYDFHIAMRCFARQIPKCPHFDFEMDFRKIALRLNVKALIAAIVFLHAIAPIDTTAEERRRTSLDKAAAISQGTRTHKEKASSRPVDFNGVWEMADISIVTVPETNTENFTDLAQERIKDFQENYSPSRDDPAFFCLAKGMPWAMLNRARNYPTEIYQTDDRVILFFELYDAHRNILLNIPNFPENITPSGHGYSIGHWENDTLVIETRALTATNPVSHVHRSEEARIIERWSMQEHPQFGEVFVNDMIIYDSIIYKEPATAHFVMKRAPEGTMIGGYNCPEFLWNNHIESRQKEMSNQESSK